MSALQHFFSACGNYFQCKGAGWESVVRTMLYTLYVIYLIQTISLIRTAARSCPSTAVWITEEALYMHCSLYQVALELHWYVCFPRSCSLLTSGVTCPEQRQFENGQVSGGNNYTAIITYECNTGYKLSGRSQLKCQANGSWNGTAPSCHRTYTKVLVSLTSLSAWHLSSVGMGLCVCVCVCVCTGVRARQKWRGF